MILWAGSHANRLYQTGTLSCWAHPARCQAGISSHPTPPALIVSQTTRSRCLWNLCTFQSGINAANAHVQPSQRDSDVELRTVPVVRRVSLTGPPELGNQHILQMRSSTSDLMQTLAALAVSSPSASDLYRNLLQLRWLLSSSTAQSGLNERMLEF